MINVSEIQLKIIIDIIKKYVPHCEVRAYGSRYKWTSNLYSDLDLSIVGEDKLDWIMLEDIEEAFQESNLPFRVDILDWNAISPEFKKVIEQGYEVIYTGY